MAAGHMHSGSWVISVNCVPLRVECTHNKIFDYSSRNFLESLADATGGRFHSYPDTSLSEDIALMTREIMMAQQDLSHTNNIL